MAKVISNDYRPVQTIFSSGAQTFVPVSRPLSKEPAFKTVCNVSIENGV